MKSPAIKYGVAVVAAVGVSGGARADTITGRFTYQYLQSVNVTTPVSSGNVNTVKFNWTRQDSPGAGIDALIPRDFNSACIEPSQGVSSGVNNIFNVVTMDAHGFSSQQQTLLQRVWGDYFPQINTADKSAAFQLAVWEIVHDMNPDLSSGQFRANTTTPAVTLASTWLSAVSSPGYSRADALPTLMVLQSSSAQDQIVAIPTPATAALSAIGLGAIAARRRRR